MVEELREMEEFKVPFHDAEVGGDRYGKMDHSIGTLNLIGGVKSIGLLVSFLITLD